MPVMRSACAFTVSRFTQSGDDHTCSQRGLQTLRAQSGDALAGGELPLRKHISGPAPLWQPRPSLCLQACYAPGRCHLENPPEESRAPTTKAPLPPNPTRPPALRTLSVPLQLPVASWVPSGENAHPAMGRSSPISELWFTSVLMVDTAGQQWQ